MSTRQGDWDAPHPSWREAAGTRDAHNYVGPCGKKVYRFYSHAASDAKKIRRKQESYGRPEVYWCKLCRGYHTGRLVGQKPH